MMLRNPFAMTCMFAALCLMSLAQAETVPRATIFDLKLGTKASALTSAGSFSNLACGSAGGPAMRPVAHWSDFAACPSDADGLHEITFRYDDSAERLARAIGDVSAAWSLGTTYNYFPIIASALFDSTGTLTGLRIVSDPRYDPKIETFLHLRPRQEHYLLGLYLMDRFGVTSSNCRDLPPAAGESPVLGMFVKQSCELTRGGRRYTIERRLLRRRGESDIDPVMGTMTEGQYLSETWAEVRLVNP